MHALVLSTLLLIHQTPAWGDAPPLPSPVANNATVAIDTGDGPAVFSFMGLDTTRVWSGVRPWAFRWTLDHDRWDQISPVPGPGRLAGTAQAVGGRIYLFGGYTVAEDGSEKSLPNVDIYDPEADAWSRGADIPIPVDDAISGVWRDSLIYLVSGWHDTGNVDRVQIYDPARNRWQQGTPIPGVPVFGHAGGVAGDAIVYLGGARVTEGSPRYAIEPGVWRGDIDPSDPTSISWRPIAGPAGPPLYRAAAGTVPGRVVFAGGTDNPYNYSGIGYDGRPAEPESAVFAYDVATGAWIPLTGLEVGTMDHRNLVVAGDRAVLIGGMLGGQQVTDRVTHIRAAALQSNAGDGR